MSRPVPLRRQDGASLIVAIVFLLLLATLALTGLRASTTNVTIVGNMQARQEVSATAQMLIEQTVSSDEFARNPLGVLQAAREEGLRVPEDLSVIGYDDIEVAEYLGLTTVRQLLFESGQCGVNLLIDRLEKPDIEPAYIELPTELIIRNTTAAPP